MKASYEAITQAPSGLETNAGGRELFPKDEEEVDGRERKGEEVVGSELGDGDGYADEDGPGDRSEASDYGPAPDSGRDH
jgi:hypothetical protein